MSARDAAGGQGGQGGVLIVDFGAQYCQLIARRVRELSVYSAITTPQKALLAAKAQRPEAIVLSGGPSSVYAHDAPELSTEILGLGLPMLGICYGLQWLAEALGGQVTPGGSTGGEYGRTEITADTASELFAGVPRESTVWMSHGDKVARLPSGFEALAQSRPCPIAAAGDRARRIYGLQFHPEVHHTEHGQLILRNFVLGIARCEPGWSPGSIVERKIEDVGVLVGSTGEVVMGLSGGVDSSVAAVLIHRAIKDRLHCVFVDNGLLRHGEREQVEHLFHDQEHVDLVVVDARARFLEQMRSVVDPEQKRKIVGRVFVDVFRDEAKRFTHARFLGQGTLYPDVIESVSAHGGATAMIKSHHNVGGLPKDLDLVLVEPLRDLFKDEVRAIGRELGLPAALVDRQPFPGPGLAVRCLGEVSEPRLVLLRAADAIVREEIESRGLQKGLWQYFAVLLPVQTVGVMGDGRTYASACVLRVVSSQDGMTADWECLPIDVLRKISNRICNEVRGINRVCLDITSKPPGTIEWE
jgi:GMP synthase (glutamine-hydrolysing)